MQVLTTALHLHLPTGGSTSSRPLPAQHASAHHGALPRSPHRWVDLLSAAAGLNLGASRTRVDESDEIDEIDEIAAGPNLRASQQSLYEQVKIRL
jgi:hypothetical protein